MTDKDGAVLEMAEAPVIGAAGPLPDGHIVQGEFLGFKEGGPFERRDGTKGESKPKIGMRLPGGEVVSIRVPDNDTARQIGRSYGKADRLAVAVRPRPPFGATGPIGYALAGSDDDSGGWE